MRNLALAALDGAAYALPYWALTGLFLAALLR